VQGGNKMTPDKKIGIPMAVPIIGGEQQKVSMDEVIQKLMQNIHQLKQDYTSFVHITNEVNTRIALLETRMSAVENKQTAFPSKIEVVVKQKEEDHQGGTFRIKEIPYAKMDKEGK